MLAFNDVKSSFWLYNYIRLAVLQSDAAFHGMHFRNLSHPGARCGNQPGLSLCIWLKELQWSHSEFQERHRSLAAY